MHVQLFDDTEGGTQVDIMRATFSALSDHGYDQLTISKIGNYFGKSNSLIYHYYDGKDELLFDFFDYLLTRMPLEVTISDETTVHEQLWEIIDLLLSLLDNEEGDEFVAALVELQSQATQRNEFREQITEADRTYYDNLLQLIEKGIDEGEYCDTDPEAVVQFIQTVISGAMVRDATIDRATNPAVIRGELQVYFQSRLLNPE